MIYRILFSVAMMGGILAADASERPGRLYFEDDRPVLAIAANAAYVISDWRGNDVLQGSADADGRVALGPMAAGYYTLRTADNESQTFAVTSDPARRPPRRPDTPFAVDAAISGMQSVLSFPGGKGYAHYAELARNAGIAHVRERLSWRLMSPSPGSFQPGRFREMADCYARNGIGVCAVWQDSPPWCPKRNQFPDDPSACYEFSRKLAAEFKGRIDSWEFWNEMEGNGLEGGCWNFVTLAKAAYLGLKAGNPECEVLSGSFCTRPDMFEFWKSMVSNGYTDYIDIYNYHVYEPLAEYPKLIALLKDTLAESGCAEMPIRVTENSIWQSPLVIGKKKIMVNGEEKAVQTPEQELLHAEAVVKMQLLLAAYGVDRTYTFVLPPYNEGEMDWGMVRYDHSAKPALAAFSNLTNQLGDAQYLGELETGDEAIRAFCWKKGDGSFVTVCWSSSEVEGATPQARSLELPVRQEALLADFFGKTSPLDLGDGTATLELDRFPVYLHSTAIPGSLKDIPRRQTRKGGTDFAADKDIVLQLIPTDSFQVAKSKLALWLQKEATTRKLTIRVFNFSDGARIVRLDGVPGIIGLPAELEVGAGTKGEIEVELVDGSQAQFSTRFHVSGSADGRAISPLDFSVLRFDASEPEWQLLPAALRPENWTANSSGEMTITHEPEQNALRFECTFDDNCKDRWAYPYLDLQKAGMNPGELAAFRFEIITEQTAAEVSRNNLVMLDKGGWAQYQPGTGAAVENFIEIPDPRELKTIAIGMNPTKNRIVWHLRNFRFIRPLQRN